MYETLEQSIIELWKSRGLKVKRIEFEGAGDGKFRWTITATEVE